MRKMFFYLICFVVIPTIAFLEEPKPYTLSVCAIFKNEAPYLQEWIEYHKLVGVEHFYLYNNGSEDNYLEILSPYIQAKEVTLTDWQNKNMSLWGNKIWAWVYSTQVTAYEHAFEKAKDTSKWIAAIDIDEFIVPIKAAKITQILEKYDKHFPGIQIFWRVYGTSDIDDISSNRLLIETLNKKSFAFHPINKNFKTILKPDQYKNYYWPPHECNYIDGKKSYIADSNEIVINHYLNRTKKYFYSNKINKKEFMDNKKLSAQQVEEMSKIGNDLEDTDRFIHCFVPSLRKKIHLDDRIINLICNFDIEDLSLSTTLYKDAGITLRVRPQLQSKRELSSLNPESEKIIIFNQMIHPSLLSKIPKEKLIFMLWEPWELPKDYYEFYSRVYTWNDELIDNVKFFKIYAPNLLPMEKNLPPFEEKKFCVMIAGSDIDPPNRKDDLYSERVRMVEFFETKPKGKLEIYGRSWNKRYYRDYLFPIPGAHSGKQKISVLKNYRFCICFENTKNIKGYITEKIFDCFAAGCVPIYWGADNVDTYIPKNCFIDYRDFSSREELYSFLHTLSKQEYEEYIHNIRIFLESKKAQLFSRSNFQDIFYNSITEDSRVSYTTSRNIHSFDIFDTVIGRLHLHPDSIFDLVEKNYPFPNFKHQRKTAEQLSNGTFHDIYQKMKTITNINEEEIVDLMKCEIETEKTHIFPIFENLSLIKNGDILISDSYYDIEQIKQLLTKVGLKKNVAIHVSPGGKSSGILWEKVKKENWGIALHMGDNLHSDIHMAKQYNIPTKHYINSQLSNREQKTLQMGNAELAYLMRALRLQNPYHKNSPEYEIWNEQSQCNIPILIEGCLYLDEFCKAHQKKRILFSSRGTCLWKALFEKMFPQYESIYFETSRHIYLNPSSSYIEYVRSVYTPDSIIVDEQGSGDSCLHFFKKHLDCQPIYLAIVNVDLLQYRHASEDILKIPRFGMVKTSQGYSNKIEMINCDLIGVLKDFNKNNPIRIKPEYDLKFVIPSHECVKKCVELLPYYSFTAYDQKLLRSFLDRLESQIIAYKYIQHVPDHFSDSSCCK